MKKHTEITGTTQQCIHFHGNICVISYVILMDIPKNTKIKQM